MAFLKSMKSISQEFSKADRKSLLQSCRILGCLYEGKRCKGTTFDKRKIPARFRPQKKNRDKWPRDDVYFYCDQAPPKHTLREAVDTIKAYNLFEEEDIELSLTVNMGEGKAKIGTLKGLLHLPKPVGKAQVILVFAEGKAAEEAREAGADIVGGMDVVKQVEKGELQFNHCLSTLDFLPNIKHLPRILKDKMPNTRRGTATEDVASVLKNYKFGETYLADREGLITQKLGRTDFTFDEIKANVEALVTAVDTHKTVSRPKFFLTAKMKTKPGSAFDIYVSDILPKDSS